MKKEMKEDESTDVKVVVLKQPPKDHGTIRVADTTQPVKPWCLYRWISGSLTFLRSTPNGESALANSPRTWRQPYRHESRADSPHSFGQPPS